VEVDRTEWDWVELLATSYEHLKSMTDVVLEKNRAMSRKLSHRLESHRSIKCQHLVHVSVELRRWNRSAKQPIVW